MVKATAIFRLEVPDPGAAMDAGVKLTVTPAGWPVADKATAELNPPEMAVVIVDKPASPRTVTEAGEAAIVKFADAAGFTVNVTAALCMIPPPEPVTVIG